MNLSEGMKLLEKNNFKGWIKHKNNPNIVINGSDLISGNISDEWRFEQVISSTIEGTGLYTQVESISGEEVKIRTDVTELL